MSNFIRSRPGYSQTIGVTTANTRQTSITGLVGSKSAWVELVGSVDHDTCGMYYYCGYYASGVDDNLFDIAVGAAGSEVVIVANIQSTVAYRTVETVHAMYIPLSIKRGQRISMRARSYGTTALIRHTIILQFAGGWLPNSYARSATYGITESDCGGVLVDPGATTGTWGSWSEITASTTSDIQFLVMCIGARDNAALTTAQWGYQIAVGASGNEVVIVADLSVVTHGTTDTLTPGFHMVHAHIPAGARIAVRSRCSISDATDRLHDASIIGFS